MVARNGRLSWYRFNWSHSTVLPVKMTCRTPGLSGYSNWMVRQSGNVSRNSLHCSNYRLPATRQATYNSKAKVSWSFRAQKVATRTVFKRHVYRVARLRARPRQP